jgi:hypothetical protein
MAGGRGAGGAGVSLIDLVGRDGVARGVVERGRCARGRHPLATWHGLAGGIVKRAALPGENTAAAAPSGEHRAAEKCEPDRGRFTHES